MQWSMQIEGIILYVLILVIGCCIGSFLNVCIYRIPNREDITTTRSHCFSCGNVLKWYDMFPIISYIVLRGKCRKCHAKISVQYPTIELLNGILYLLIVFIKGFEIETIFVCLLASCLIVLSVIDWRIYEIPVGLNVFIAILGVVNLIIHYTDWTNYLIGAFCVSGFMFVLFVLTKGRGIGGGDIKLMFAAGLLLGWQNIILAFALGCIIGSVIHLLRMRLSGEEHVLAFGPYLSVGIMIAALWGEQIIKAYLTLVL